MNNYWNEKIIVSQMYYYESSKIHLEFVNHLIYYGYLLVLIS